MLGAAGLAYLVDVFVLTLFAAIGTVSVQGVVAYLAVAAAASATFYGLIRSGANLRLADPSLTLPQLLVCSAIQIGFALALPSLATVFIINLFVAFAFGILQQKQREFLIAGAFVAIGLFFVLVREVPPTQVIFGSSSERLVFWVFIVLALGRFTTVSIAASELRATLHERNRELRQSLAKIEELATRDHLTKLYNRRHMDSLIAQELSRADRGGDTFCLAVVDIDHFKSINDRHGHDTGDKTLVEFGRLLPMMLRDTDQVARWGGEEFVVLLVATAIAGGTEVMERLRARVEGNDWSAAEIPVSPTCSIGVAERQADETIDDVLRRADAALYAAKHGGRNRVVSAAS